MNGSSQIVRLTRGATATRIRRSRSRTVNGAPKSSRATPAGRLWWIHGEDKCRPGDARRSLRAAWTLRLDLPKVQTLSRLADHPMACPLCENPALIAGKDLDAGFRDSSSRLHWPIPAHPLLGAFCGRIAMDPRRNRTSKAIHLDPAGSHLVHRWRVFARSRCGQRR